MGEITKIQWCDHTFNPWRGCTKVSAGCAHCYAETLSKRNPGVLGVWGPNGTRVVASEAKWREPLKWDKEAKAAGVRRRVFCASLADALEDWDGPMVDADKRRLWRERLVPMRPWTPETPQYSFANMRPLTMSDVRMRLWETINTTQYLDYLLLTKRPENARRLLPDRWLDIRWPPNVWLGTTVENRAAKARIDILRETPAAVRFLSIEPLLEDLGELDLTGIHWVIFGGESGPDARPCDLAWIRDGVRQCKAAGVAPFVKQVGSAPRTTLPDFEVWPGHTGPKSPVQLGGDGFGNYTVHGLRDKKGGDPSEWPADLRVREMPSTAVHV